MCLHSSVGGASHRYRGGHGFESRWQTDLAPNVCPHSSASGASHWYRGGHGFESRWSHDIFWLLSNCLNWKIYCHDHSSLSYTTAVQTWIISCILNIISLLGKIWTQLTNLAPNVCLQLVEHRTGIAEVTGLNPVEALIFSGIFFQLLKLENFLPWSLFPVWGFWGM